MVSIRKAVACGAALLVLCAAPAPTARAADEIEGEILDLACYIPKRAKGPAHRKCAQTCAEHGMPLGLLTDDDAVYLLYPRHGQEDSEMIPIERHGGRYAQSCTTIVMF